MFTGIIECVGRVKCIEKKGGSGRIEIEAPLDLASVGIGGSIAVDGACLTVTAISKGVFSADVSAETLALTTLSGVKPGASVNLERPLTLSTPLGGHIVTGHVDCVGMIEGLRDSGGLSAGGFKTLAVSFPKEFSGQVVKKGSVAIDGISLTVAEAGEGLLTAAIIPHTLKGTALGSKSAGEPVNVETDIIAKYVERLLAGRSSGGGITPAFLAEHGFTAK